MLHEFVTANHELILERGRERAQARAWPFVSRTEIDEGLPLFLTQLVETLRLESTPTPFPADELEKSATKYGGQLLAAGFTINQVVHDHGNLCQVITELAIEQNAPITVEEFHVLNRSLDVAIAEAVTEFTRVTAATSVQDDVTRQGQAAHDLRDLTNTALLAFQALKAGPVNINGSTGAVLGRSLMGLRDLADRSLTEVRLSAGKHRRELVPVATLIDDVAAAGMLHSEYRGIVFTAEAVDGALTVSIDRQLLGSALLNLLHNAFKYTRPQGRVILRARGEGPRLLIEVEDQCGGLHHDGDLFAAFGERRGADRSGLGLGLSIARKAVRAHDGDIFVRNFPGTGCMFVIDIPLAESIAASEVPA